MMTPTYLHEARQADAAQPSTLGRIAPVAAFLTAIAGVLYSVSFVFIKENLTNGMFLMLGGLLGSLVLVAVYEVVRPTDAGLALVGLVLAILGMGGAIIHGGYDLALGANPVPTLPPGVADLPSQVDPRGLLTFGVSGLAVFTFTYLMKASRRFSAPLIYTGLLLGILMEVLYLGRLIILDAKNPLIVVAAVLAGLIVNPAWYVLLGLQLRSKR